MPIHVYDKFRSYRYPCKSSHDDAGSTEHSKQLLFLPIFSSFISTALPSSIYDLYKDISSPQFQFIRASSHYLSIGINTDIMAKLSSPTGAKSVSRWINQVSALTLKAVRTVTREAGHGKAKVDINSNAHVEGVPEGYEVSQTSETLRQYNTNTTGDDLLKDLSGEIKGKVIVTTGVTLGSLGGTFVQTIAKAQPAVLILAARSLDKAQATADAIKAAHPNIDVRKVQLDLSSFAAVREAAATIDSWKDIPHIDVLVNNAGIMGTEFKLTVDGYEQQFASNHLGHFLFTNLIMDKLLASKAPRVVSVSSEAHRLSPIRWSDYNFSVCFSPFHNHYLLDN